MWLGSNAQHEILEPHFVKDGLVWTPGSVSRIMGWRARESIPSYMQIELTTNQISAEASESNEAQRLETSQMRVISHSMISVLPVDHSAFGKSLMTILPSIVIRAPQKNQNLNNLSPDVPRKVSSISWFN